MQKMNLFTVSLKKKRKSIQLHKKVNFFNRDWVKSFG